MKRLGQRYYFSGVATAVMIALCAIAISSFAANTPANAPAGSVTAWGYNGLGSLGNATTASSTQPVTVALPLGSSAAQIAVGQFHNLALTDVGVYFWGDGITLPVKVNFPAEATVTFSAAAGMSHSLVLTDAGLYGWGGNGAGQLGDGTTIDRSDPVKVIFPPSVTQILGVAAGYYHSLAITDGHGQDIGNTRGSRHR